VLLEVEGARRSEVCVVETQRAQRGPLARTGGAEHLGAQVPCELDRGHAHAAGGSVDEQALAGLEMAEVHEAVVGREKNERDARGLEERPAGGYPSEHAVVGDGHRAEGAGNQAHDPIAGAKRVTSALTSVTTPAPSQPRGPASPGYMPGR
jgi:hypothetical protein